MFWITNLFIEYLTDTYL